MARVRSVSRVVRLIREFTTELNRDDLDKRYDELVFLGHPGLDFFVLIAASSVIAAAGFVMDSPAVIIGAMVISPLLHPVVLMGSALARADFRHGLSLLGMSTIGIGLVFIVSASLGLIWSSFEYGTEITSRLTSSPGLYALVAFVSGVAGALAFYWPDISESITGVSISVALLPPVVMVGIAASRADLPLMWRSLSIAAINVAGLVLAALFVTRFLWWFSGRQVPNHN